MDFILPEDAEMDIWRNFDNSREEESIPFAPVPRNVIVLYPQGYNESSCVVGRVTPKTHALFHVAIMFYV